MTSLHDPLPLPCGQVLPNRIMKAAMSEALADSGNSPDARLERLYRTWSQGGYGLLVTGNVMVDRTQLGEPGNVVIEDDRDLDALTRWAKSAHDAGVPIWVQLNHPGRQSNPLAVGHIPVAPSAVPMNLPGSPTPRELTSPEIEDIIERFVTAAAVCETAGFDGVQVHGAHGYLVTQFLSPLTNLRDDDWGGDPPRRMRFLLEIVRRIRARVSPGFAVSVKLNSADFQRGGFSEDESRDVVAALAGEGLDMIEISGGNYESPAMSGSAAASTRAREAYFLDYARTVRQLAGDVPLAVTGGFRSRAAMQEALHAGDCDVVGLARPTVTTPDAAAAILSERMEVLPTRELQLRDAPRPRQIRRRQGTRRRAQHQLEHRPTAPTGRRPRAGPRSRPAGHDGGHASPQRRILVPPQAGHPMRRPSYDLRGKVVLITGGTGGIGSATARRTHRPWRESGHRGRRPRRHRRSRRACRHTAAMGAVADVRARDALDVAVADVVDRFGRVDVAIANAGILSRAATLRTTPTSSIDSLLAVNVTGVVNTVQAAMDQVIAHRGQFVLISSVFAFLNGMGTIPYAMSKSAVEQLGRGLRVELADTRRLDHDRLLLAHRNQHDQTGRRRRPHRRRTALGPAAAPAQTPPTRAAAATALADGLAHRSPRVMAPSRWKPISALRGLIAPAMDSHLARDRRTLAALSKTRRAIPHRA